MCWQPSPGSPVLAVLSWQSCPGSPVLAVLSCQSCPVSPVLAVLSCQSSPGSPVLTVLFCLSCSAYPVLPVLFCSSCSGYPFHAVLYWLFSYLSCTGCIFLAVTCRQACPGRVVLTVPSWQSSIYIYIYIYEKQGARKYERRGKSTKFKVQKSKRERVPLGSTKTKKARGQS